MSVTDRNKWFTTVVVVVLMAVMALGAGANAVVAAQQQPAPIVLHLTVDYDARGVPSIAGVSANHLALLGVNAPVAIAPEQLRVLQTNNVYKIVLQTEPDGLYLSINDAELPHLSWNAQNLQNLAKFLPLAGIYVDPQYVELLMTAATVPTLLDVQITTTFAPADN